MTLKPWREIAVPHEDVLKGTFQQAEFAADLSRVHARNATDEYQDPVLLFQRTFITEGMRLPRDSVVKRLTGRGGDPVIQLQTAFGGGKTHTMLAVYHLAKGEAPASDLQGIPPILDSGHVTKVPRAQVVVLDGNTMAPNMPQQRGRITVHTLWGELAWQLGKEDAYARIKGADTSGTSPGKEALAQGGRVVTVGGHSGQRSRYADQDFAKKGQWVRPMGVFNEAQGDVDQRGWAQMKSWFETGMLRTVVQDVFPWTEAKRVQELLASRGVFGKLVMEVR